MTSKYTSGLVEPMQKINPYAISKGSWWERQAVTTTVLTLGKMVGEVIYRVYSRCEVSEKLARRLCAWAITFLMYDYTFKLFGLYRT